MKKLFLLLFLFITTLSSSQTITSISQINYKSQDSLILGKDRSDMLNQYVTIIGIVTAPPRVCYSQGDLRTLLRGSTSWNAYIQDLSGSVFGGITVRQATRGPNTLFDRIDSGSVIKVSGYVREFWGTNSVPGNTGWLTQLEVDSTTQIQIISNGNRRPNPILLKILDFGTGIPGSGGTINYANGEKYEGMYVEFKNVRVTDRLANRQPWSITDSLGNKLYVRDFSNFFSSQPSGDTLIHGYQHPPVGVFVKSIKGVIINSNNEGIFGTTLPYVIVPIYPNDVIYDNFVSINENIEIKKYSLSQNYPNPFNPVTKINFQIKNSGLVELKVYNTLGKEVQTLINQRMNSGEYSTEFDGNNLSNGIYFYTLKTNEFSETKKMILIK